MWVGFVVAGRRRDSSVGIATGYELESPGSIPGSASFFLLSATSRPALRLTQPSIQWVPGVKRQGRDADHSLHLVPMSRNVELCLHFPICPNGIGLN
jgi:hypothetical protein